MAPTRNSMDTGEVDLFRAKCLPHMTLKGSSSCISKQSRVHGRHKGVSLDWRDYYMDFAPNFNQSLNFTKSLFIESHPTSEFVAEQKQVPVIKSYARL